MEITLYRYNLDSPTWSMEHVDQDSVKTLVNKIMALPFQGERQAQYGFAHCGSHGNDIYGLFIQKFRKVLTDYDPKTKIEKKEQTIDSGEYLFIFRPKRYEIYLQSHRSADLPDKKEMVRRFTSIMKLALNNTKFMFSQLLETQDKVNRDRIVKIFYEEADEILEMEFENFDESLIAEEKRKRGSIRRYFNPKEEYQEGMEEAAISIARNADKASIKAKKDGNLKKDPITRALLEGSRQPTKIVYKKEQVEHIAKGITKQKTTITITGSGFNFETTDQIVHVLSELTGQEASFTKKYKKDKKTMTLFDNKEMN